MIILRIPRRTGNRGLREFILNNIKKFKRNQKRKYIQLQGEIAYSTNYVYFILPDRGLELAFALSICFKCQRQNIPCELHLSKPIIDKLPQEIIEAAKVWTERKLHRKYYKLKNLKL